MLLAVWVGYLGLVSLEKLERPLGTSKRQYFLGHLMLSFLVGAYAFPGLRRRFANEWERYANATNPIVAELIFRLAEKFFKDVIVGTCIYWAVVAVGCFNLLRIILMSISPSIIEAIDVYWANEHALEILHK